MRSWCRRRSGERKGEGADLCGSSSAGIRAALAASKCTFNETLLTFKHEWPRQAKHHGSLLMAHMWSALTAEHVFYWLHVSVSVLGIHLNQGPSCSTQCIILFCSGYRGTKTNSIATLKKPMTKAVNNRQELHWNKSLSNPTKVDKKKKKKWCWDKLNTLSIYRRAIFIGKCYKGNCHSDGMIYKQ